ncbi:PPOX class F420-dependent oxidoreductase [Micromonospora sp. WMMD882]|uniref:PPOX class F420-dependent oxidoreductase n=1 Tax=Micromonospora sp. WMMD882 TaxID=3015151 RepID=UPI00248CA7B3|nr:PPOX class F420-dependent oxidoreductase [Micromonospora sp. WMMD882]WBB79547.1 PPOX class F420-dependent oxidoreductase [Micromonospora sp. WMMD882]
MPDTEYQDALLALIADRRMGVLATIRRDGRPQQSTVMHGFDREARVIRVSVTDGRAKTKNLLRDPRASYHVSSADGWAYAVAEARAELTPVAGDPHDAVVEELVELYRSLSGEHPDWDDYRRAMVEQRRMVLRLHVERVVGIPPRG